jgi:N-acetylmuramoyl-L-alanine amidase
MLTPMHLSRFLVPVVAALLASCAAPPPYPLYPVYRSESAAVEPPESPGLPSETGPRKTGGMTAQQMRREVRVYPRLISLGSYGRRYKRPMNPTYITIHATENRTGDAFAHAAALRNGRLRATRRKGGNRIGFLTWHFTVQEDLAVQHLPTREQGEHADFDGPGNNYSIGIEMCEHRGNSISATIDRTAKLAAVLMYENRIPLNHVVPHYHWPRRGAHPAHKNCPHFLLDHGRPGRKWAWFLGKVKTQYNRLGSRS